MKVSELIRSQQELHSPGHDSNLTVILLNAILLFKILFFDDGSHSISKNNQVAPFLPKDFLKTVYQVNFSSNLDYSTVKMKRKRHIYCPVQLKELHKRGEKSSCPCISPFFRGNSEPLTQIKISTVREAESYCQSPCFFLHVYKF